jgi:hypothetical protein
MNSSAGETPQPTEPSDPSKTIDTLPILEKLNYGSKINGAVLDFKDPAKLKESYANACPIEYTDDFLKALQQLESAKSEMSGDENLIQTMRSTNDNCKETWVSVLYKHYFRDKEGFEKLQKVKLGELKTEFGDKFDDDVLKYMAYNKCFPEIRFKLPETGILYFKDYGVIASVQDALKKDRDFASFNQGPLQKILNEVFKEDDDRRLEASQPGKQMQTGIQSAFEQKLTIKLNSLMDSFLTDHFTKWRQQQGALIEYTLLFDKTTHPMLQDADTSLAGNRHFPEYPSEWNRSSGAYDIVVTRMWSEIRKIYDEWAAVKGQTSEFESIIPNQYQNQDDWNTYHTKVRAISEMFNNKGLQTPNASSWDGYDIAELQNKSRNSCLINRVFTMHYAWINAYRNLRVIELLCRRPDYKDKFAKKQSEGQGNDAGDLPGMELQDGQNLGLITKRKAQQEAHEQMLKRGRAIIEECVANKVFALDQTEQEAREKAKEAYIKAGFMCCPSDNEESDGSAMRAAGSTRAISHPQKKTKKQRKADKQEEDQRKAEWRLGRASYSARKQRQKRPTPFVRREPGEKEPNKYYDNQQIKKIAEQARNFQALLSYYYIDSDNVKKLFETIPVMDADKSLTKEQTFVLHSDLNQILGDVLFYTFNVQSEQPDYQEKKTTTSLFRKYCHRRNIPFWAEVKAVSEEYLYLLRNRNRNDEEEERERVSEAMYYVRGSTAFDRSGPGS